MLLGWAWGCAAMAAGLSVRSSKLLAQQQQKLQSSLVQMLYLTYSDLTSHFSRLVPGTPVSLQIESQTFHGIFLDPRLVIIF